MPDGQAFVSPQAAVQALTNALRSEDTARLLQIVGSEGQDILQSGDEVADRQRRQEFLSLYDKKHLLKNESVDKATLQIGDSDWPFPVPLVKTDKGWAFDCAAGKEDILNRRIGKNELSAINVCEAIADAQREYAQKDRDQNGVPEFAQKFASDPGKHNGLFWPTAQGEEPSPLGELAADAAAEGYVRRAAGPTPYHGYYYRILTGQGPHAPGGPADYIVNGQMVLGFAVIAYPADYGNSGIMTFLMGPNGRVFQKDLGPATPEAAAGVKLFDPDQSWKEVPDAKDQLTPRVQSAAR